MISLTGFPLRVICVPFRLSPHTVDVRFAPGIDRFFAGQQMTQMGRTGRAPAPKRPQSVAGFTKRRSTAMARISTVHAVTVIGIDMGKNTLQIELKSKT